METIALFPLNAVLFPGGPLKLRIFEPRYLDMVGRCMRSNEEFGVAVIVEGKEAGAARTAEVGTAARIFDFETLKDGLLGISARGTRRFRIESVLTQHDGLNVATVEFFAPDRALTPGPEFIALAQFVTSVFPHVSAFYSESQPLLDDANWLAGRAAELLPLSLSDRQYCLELDDPQQRLVFLKECLERLGVAPSSS